MKNSKKLTYISRAALMILTCVLIILFFGIMSLVSRIQGTARVVNYAGLVRGKTQRIIKLEEAGQHVAYEQVMLAVSDFEKGNMRLSVVLTSMEHE